MRNKISLLVATSLILVVIAGCAKTADSVVKTPVIPDTPDGTVLAVAKAIENNHLEILWHALPESYQQALNEITKLFAEKMDPAVYDRGFDLVMRAIEVLDDRKEIILASETFKSTGADAEEIREGLSNTHIFTGTLKTSEVATIDGLSTVDWEQFLANTGGEMLEKAAAIESEKGNPFSDLATIKVETIEVTEDTATLMISSEEHEPEEVKMVRVEGRWIPADMAEEWPTFVKEAREGLAEITPETMAAQKTQVMMFFGMADGLIEQIASLQTPEEFDAAIGPMLAPFLGGGMGMGMDEEEEWTYEEEPETVEE
jgi:hypothetical protein